MYILYKLNSFCNLKKIAKLFLYISSSNTLPNNKMETFCHALPKIELHAHLNGSLSETIMKQLGCDVANIEEFKKLNQIFEKTTRTLDECFELFKIAHNATSNVQALYTACCSVIEDFHKDNVVYLELRTTPRAEAEMSKEAYIETVIRAIKDNKFDIIVKLILSIDRRHSGLVSNESVDLIIKFHRKYPDIVKGVDFSGNPNNGIFDWKLFDKVRSAGLKITLHCGEVKNDKEVLEMINFKPERIGHATCLHPNYSGSDEIWAAYSQYLIPAEICLSSNVMCGTSASYENHHIQEWLKLSLPFCLATDDKGVFSTTLSKEFIIAANYYKLEKEDLWNIGFNSIKYTFASEKEKEDLRQIFLKWKSDHLSK